jgi:D-glycero-D-manno-heptose 1,7-bisphosphate phosphatase
MRRKAIFLDRDGVLNQTFVRGGVPHPPATLAEFELLPNVPKAVDWFRSADFCLIVVTNQPDVARGTQNRDMIEAMHAHLSHQIVLDAVYVCYHDTPDQCDCRKPRAGMLFQAAAAHQIELSQSFMIGDRWSDIVAGATAGCTTLLLDQPYSQCERCNPDYCVADLWEAATVIARLTGRSTDKTTGETI